MIAQGESIMDPVTNPISRRNLLAVAAAGGLRVVVVRAFVKKAQKTPRAEIDLALRRAKEIT
jgi:phage-related protein